MKRHIIPASLFVAAALSLHAQQQTEAPVASPSRVFRVHVADGRNGYAIAGARIQLWYDEPAGPGYAIATGARGDALMPQPIGDPTRVLVSINGYTDCRKLDHDAPPDGFNLASIAEKGMAAQNTCGRIAVHTTPGELVLYVRPSHWYENLNKNPS
jgi:hypothetical protein